MNLALTPEQEVFRRELAEFLEGWRGLCGFFHQDREWERVRAFFAALGERGWLSLGWPKQTGGLGRGPREELLLWDEIAYRRLARPPLASGIVARSILRAGTPEQQARWLPPIRRGEIHFSLGYSEPEAGSDLASVRTRAERRGDVYVVTGEKCWTSYAQHSDYLWLLCRTGTQQSRGAGTTLLIVDLRAPGVRVTPLPTLDGETLNAVALGGVEVPAEQRIGPEGGAWTLLAEALADERHVQFPPRRLRRDLEEVAAWLAARGQHRSPAARRRARRAGGSRDGGRAPRAPRGRGDGEGPLRAAPWRRPTRWPTPSAPSASPRRGSSSAAPRLSPRTGPSSSSGARASGRRSAAAPRR